MSKKRKIFPIIFCCLLAMFVGNINTYKFHHSWCHLVNRMAPKHQYWTDSRQELVDMGMVPCKKCRP